MSAALLVQSLREPASAEGLDAAGWNSLIAAARAEQLIGSLAHRLNGLALPAPAEQAMADARAHARFIRRQALWEADRARAALTETGVPIILLKGTAYAAAGLKAGIGRSIGDLDIMVPFARLDAVEAGLIAAGWVWAKPDDYDDQYYRRWRAEERRVGKEGDSRCR